MIRPAEDRDADAIVRIYNHYILHEIATFEERAITARDMRDRMEKIEGDGFPWLVAEEAGRVVGYAYAGKWNARAAYRFSAETTVYLDPASLGRGWGTRLYQVVFDFLRGNSFHAAMAGISLPNAGSVALHEKFGMRKVAHFREVGFKFNAWIDVGYWQVLL